MYFPHNGSIITIDHIVASDNHHPNLNLAQNTPWYVPNVQVDLTPPCVNYVGLYAQYPISSNKDPLNYYFPSRDFIN